MPTGTIEILRMPCSMSSGEYPLLTSKSQSLTAYTVKSIEGRYTEDLQQSLTIPEFSGWSECNMMRIGGVLYWIIDSRTSTDTARSIRFEISACGPSSILHKGDSIKGIYSRLPTNECPYLQISPISSSLKIGKMTSLDCGIPAIDGLSDDINVFWVQITTTQSTTDKSALTRYGAFVYVHRNGLMTDKAPCGETDKYVSLSTIMNSIEEICPASTVQDISISSTCPFNVFTTSISYYLKAAGIPGYVAPNRKTAKGDYYYDIEALTTGQWIEPYVESFSYSWLTELERSCGTCTFRDWNGNSVGVWPAQWGRTVTYTVRCVSDYTGITTYLDVKPSTPGTWGNYTYGWQEGHLPWVGSQWEEYKAYSMSYDRQAMEQSIDYAKQRIALGIAEAGANAVSNIAMGAIGGNPLSVAVGAISGAASFGIQTWASAGEQRISESEARATQALSERRVQGAPGVPYNTGYGINYCLNSWYGSPSFWVEIPDGLTQEVFDSYVDQFGYPAENVRAYQIQKGFIQGRLLDNAITRGRLFDRANDAIQRGIKFVEV